MRNKILITILVLLIAAGTPFALTKAVSKNSWDAVWMALNGLNQRVTSLEKNGTTTPSGQTSPTVQNPISTPPFSSPPAQSKFQYKVVTFPDPCTLNQLGGQGWEIVNYGDLSDVSTTFDENCKKLPTAQIVKTYNALVLEKAVDSQ